MRADAWAALAAWFTVVIALGTVVVAGFYAHRQVEQAKRQVGEAQSTRREQAQPNVVMFAEPNHTIWHDWELVVKNFGSTPAYDIEIAISPKPQVSPKSSQDTAADLHIPETIPILAPSQEWRTSWDYAPNRFKAEGMATRHEGAVTYKDSRGETFSTASVLDWDMLKDTQRLEIKSIHHVAKLIEKQNVKLDGIAKTLAAFTSPDKGIFTFGGDAAQAVAERNAEAVESERQMRRMIDRLEGAGGASSTDARTVEPRSTEPDPPQQEPGPE